MVKLPSKRDGIRLVLRHQYQTAVVLSLQFQARFSQDYGREDPND
jgi:hypothetical protein